jgi:multidrug resistance efflux pump
LANAAQAVREFEVCGQRCTDLGEGLSALQADLATAQERYAGEAKDVDRLQHLSLTRVLASLHGSRDDALAREQADAQAAQAAAEADQRLATLRTDLADIGSLEPTAPGLVVSAGLRFTDTFFNNIFTDLAVGHQIRQAQDNVDRSAQLVGEVRARLTERIDQAQERLAAITAQREQLLTR